MSRSAVKLRVERLSKAFPAHGGAVEVLRQVTFDVADQEFVSIIGRSGCGKTTLLRIIAGLERASAGEVLLDQGNALKSVSIPGPDRGMVFQEHFLFPWRTARQNIEFGLEFLEKDRHRRHEIAREYLKLVNLEEAGDRYPSQLSGGMRQRVAIARALATDPKILLLDEPFASLDTQTRSIFHDELLRIWRVTRKTILLVTHSIDEAVYLSDRIVVLKPNPGEVLEIVQPGLPRPRSRSSPAVLAVVESLNQMLGLSQADKSLVEKNEAESVPPRVAANS
jgi:NitT/TauT family transport system ATP-binding protein